MESQLQPTGQRGPGGQGSGDFLLNFIQNPAYLILLLLKKTCCDSAVTAGNPCQQKRVLNDYPILFSLRTASCIIRRRLPAPIDYADLVFSPQGMPVSHSESHTYSQLTYKPVLLLLRRHKYQAIKTKQSWRFMSLQLNWGTSEIFQYY